MLHPNEIPSGALRFPKFLPKTRIVLERFRAKINEAIEQIADKVWTEGKGSNSNDTSFLKNK